MRSPELLFTSLYLSFVGDGVKVSLNYLDLIFKSFLIPSSVQYSSVVTWPDPGVLPLISPFLSDYHHPCSALDIIYSFSQMFTEHLLCARPGNLKPGETWSEATWLTGSWRQAHEQISILWCDRVAITEWALEADSRELFLLGRASQSIIEPDLTGNPVVNPVEGIAVGVRFHHSGQRK